jgi:hypothetical protein
LWDGSAWKYGPMLPAAELDRRAEQVLHPERVRGFRVPWNHATVRDGGPLTGSSLLRLTYTDFGWTKHAKPGRFLLKKQYM